MSRSRKQSGKATAKQNQKDIHEMRSVINQLINAMTSDVGRLNSLVFGILKEDDRIKESSCPSCGQRILSPILKAVPEDKVCPTCGTDLHKGQTTIDQWDNGEEE